MEPEAREDVDERGGRDELSVYLPFDGGVYLCEELDCAVPDGCRNAGGSQVTVPTADVNDDKLHRYGVHVDDGKGGSVEVRFLLFRKPDGNIVTVGGCLPDLRAGWVLYREPGDYVQDVRFAL